MAFGELSFSENNVELDKINCKREEGKLREIKYNPGGKRRKISNRGKDALSSEPEGTMEGRMKHGDVLSRLNYYVKPTK